MVLIERTFVLRTVQDLLLSKLLQVALVIDVNIVLLTAAIVVVVTSTISKSSGTSTLKDSSLFATFSNRARSTYAGPITECRSKP